ncbi:MAG: porin [Gammaproteobacteria bacterium]|nr:porin [Gammaproteobacteria bacterium]
MKPFSTMKLAVAFGTAALAALLTAPANAAIVLGGDNGWEVSYGGFINLFFTQSDFDSQVPACAGPTCSEDSTHMQEGLLPAFHTLTAKSPEIGGLKGTAQITFAPDSSGSKAQRLNKGGAMIDMREVFFNVSGDFGTISAGRTLALFQRQAILKDMTLFGVGALVGPDGGGTSLGRIGFGYVYPDFRTRFTYKTNDINGFNLEVGLFDPQETTGTAAEETDTPQFQTEMTYTTGFEGGSFNAWAGFLWQELEVQASTGGATGDIESFGWNVGVDVKMGGFNVVGSYYDGQALGTLLFPNVAQSYACDAFNCEEAENDGFYVQGTYTFNGKTKLGVSYGESNQDGTATGAPESDNSLWTVGVYHDINSWLKVVAEYDHQDSETLGNEADIFGVGGFILW